MHILGTKKSKKNNEKNNNNNNNNDNNNNNKNKIKLVKYVRAIFRPLYFLKEIFLQPMFKIINAIDR